MVVSTQKVYSKCHMLLNFIYVWQKQIFETKTFWNLYILVALTINILSLK